VTRPDLLPLILPPYLQKPPFSSFPALQQISDLAFRRTEDGFNRDSTWAKWREVLENVAMARYAYDSLLRVRAIPPKDYSSDLSMFVQYHSASLVTYCQGSIELTAGWFVDYYQIRPLLHRHLFHHAEARKKLREVEPRLSSFFDRNLEAIGAIHDYRVAWFHHVAGGVKIYAASAPTGDNMRFMVPRDPKILKLEYEADLRPYLKAIDECRRANKDEWLYSLDEFTDLLMGSAERIVIDALDIALASYSARRNLGEFDLP
jgi:hypothetical protein